MKKPYNELTKRYKTQNDIHAAKKCVSFCIRNLKIPQNGLTHKRAYQEVYNYLKLNLTNISVKGAINQLYYENKLKDLAVEVRPRKPKKTRIFDENSFYRTPEWEALRKRVLRKYGVRCMKCKINGIEMHVDHIKPRSLYPDLELEFENLQVLCKYCNLEKSNKDEIDYRNNKIAIPSQYAINQFEKKIKKDKKLKPIKLKTNNP